MSTIKTLKKEIKQMKRNLKDAEAKLAAMKDIEVKERAERGG